MTFKDHFSTQSKAYSQFRPAYPEALYTHLAALAPARTLAWDCATGSGQAALGLAPHFTRIEATDASAEQIANAHPLENIAYRVAPAEASGLPDACVDLISVAQAIHWFDLEAFGTEVQRVLKPQGVLAVWTYHLLKISPEIDAFVMHLYEDLLGDYWPTERRIVEQRYADIEMPLVEIEAPELDMPVALSLEALTGYLNTWSATQRYQQDRGHNPVELIAGDLREAWGAEKTRQSQWPLTLKLWKNN
ncbi:MAG: class I SAM-dependent methyltransferase [bacterium]